MFRPMLAAITATTLFAAGCGPADKGPPRYAVKGTVTLDGSPLPHGTIQFQSSGNVYGNTMAEVTQGTFSIPQKSGPIAGEYQVLISSIDKVPTPTDPEEAMRQAELPPPAEKIAEKYNSKTELKATVSESGPNEFTFAVESAGTKGK